MQALLDRHVAEGRERGAQLAVYHDGKLVVDAWAGDADPATGRKVTGETLFPVFSVSKGIAATLVHRLVERGLLSYDQAIADIWSEFGGQGKSAITLRQALNHTSAIPYMPAEAELSTLGDWRKMCALIAQLTPLYPPGTKTEYHAITYGWAIGEPACRVTGLSFGELLRQEITAPLGLEDSLFMGIPADQHPEVAVLEHQIPAPVPPPDGGPEVVPAKLGSLHDLMNLRAQQEACLPATSGVMSARAIARHYAALLPGGVDGVELLSPAQLQEALVMVENAPEEVNHLLGYALVRGRPPAGKRISAFGHGGHGGSHGAADLDGRFAVGYTRNRLDDVEPPKIIFDELWKALTTVLP